MCLSPQIKNEFVNIVKFIDQIIDAIIAYVISGEASIKGKYVN